jgi:TolB protein
MNARGPVAALLLVLLTFGGLLLASALASGGPDITTLISRPGAAPLASTGTGPSGLHAVAGTQTNPGQQVSADGRRVVFVSQAPDITGDPTNLVQQVYVRDTVANTTTLVSRATGIGGATADEAALEPVISRDGTHVAFRTDAQLDPADTDAVNDVYVRDLAGNTTTLVSVNDPGQVTTVGSGPVIDEDGSHIAFATNGRFDAQDVGTGLDVYVRDMSVPAPGMTLASRADGVGTAAVDSGGVIVAAGISDDGSRVLFRAFESGIVAGDDGDTDADLYLRGISGMGAGQTRLVSRSDADADLPGSVVTAVMNGAGTAVAFVSSTPYTAGDADASSDVFVRTLPNGPTVLASFGEDGVTSAGQFDLPTLSTDGTRLAYQIGTGLFVRDLADVGVPPEPVSVPTGTGGAAVSVGESAISGDGETVAFRAAGAAGLSPDDDDAHEQVYVRRVADYGGLSGAPETTLYVSRPSGTAPFVGPPFLVDDARVAPGAVSWDGRFVAFSTTSDLVGEADGVSHAYVRNVAADTVEVLDRASGGAGAIGDAGARVPVLSADGRYAAFVSSASNLHPDQPIPSDTGYVRDRQTDTTTIVTRAQGPAGAPVSASGVAISGDGRKVAFATSEAAVPEDTNGDIDIYVRDLTTGLNVLASVPHAGGIADGGNSTDPALDWDGDRVAFTSTATNLVGGVDTNGVADVFVRDLDAGQTILASRATGAGGAQGTAASRFPSIDGDGRRVTFDIGDGGLADGRDVLLRDLETQTTTNLTPGVGATSERGHLSEDGAFVLVESTRALDPVADTNGLVADVYRIAVGSLTPVLVSRATGAGGVVGNLASTGALGGERPALAPNGRCAAFPSLASNLSGDWAGTTTTHVWLRTFGECLDGAPSTTVESGPSDPTPSTVATPTFTLTSDARRATFVCELLPASGPAIVDGPCDATFTTPTLADGAYTLSVRAVSVPGFTDATPATRAFTVAVPDPPLVDPPPTDPPPGDATPPIATPPAGAPVPPPSVPGVPAPVVVRDPAKIRVLRAGVKSGRLDMLAEITARAGGEVDVEFEAAGRKHRFAIDIDEDGTKVPGAATRLTVDERLPSSQRNVRSGIVTLTYDGDARVRPDEVRLRAASVKALLTRGRTLIESDGDLVVDGTISSLAAGVVRVGLEYVEADGTVKLVNVNAPIRSRSGSSSKVWSVSERLPTRARAVGGQLSIQFTGYLPRDMRGEQTAKQVDP